MKPVVYKSKVGLPLVLYISLIVGAVLLIFIYHKMWILAVFILLAVSFIIHMFATTRYIVYADKIYIQCGFLYRLTVPISTIQAISETNNPISSPATSLERLEVVYDKRDRVLISPKDKIAFINHLLTLNPAIVVRLKKQPFAIN